MSGDTLKAVALDRGDSNSRGEASAVEGEILGAADPSSHSLNSLNGDSSDFGVGGKMLFEPCRLGSIRSKFVNVSYDWYGSKLTIGAAGSTVGVPGVSSIALPAVVEEVPTMFGNSETIESMSGSVFSLNATSSCFLEIIEVEVEEVEEAEIVGLEDFLSACTRLSLSFVNAWMRAILERLEEGLDGRLGLGVARFGSIL